MEKPVKGLYAGAVIFAILLIFGAGAWGADGIVGKKAPEIAVSEWVTAEAPQERDLTGRVYVVEFWATWCRPCVENVPHLMELYEKYRPQGLELVGLSADNDAEKVKEFVREKGINYHVGMDKGTRDWFGVRYYPTAAVVNHLGVVVWQGLPWKKDFEKTIIKALAAAPPPLLAEVELGPFEVHRAALFGGSRFAQAYSLVESFARDTKDPQTAAIAQRIVETIDARITEMLGRADDLRKAKPEVALAIYSDIAAKYGGIKAAEPAQIACEQMKPTKKPQILALGAASTIEVEEKK